MGNNGFVKLVDVNRELDPGDQKVEEEGYLDCRKEE
jgi:hypothetical protein